MAWARRQASLPFDPAPRRQPSRLDAAWEAWIASEDGQRVVGEVVRRALRLRERGWRRMGIAALWEAIRYDRAVEVGPDAEGFKVNNSFRSRVARLVMRSVPELAGFFATRELREPRHG